jgi:hypothetical protein
MRTLVIVTLACLLAAAIARAELMDYTGGSYEWVAYDNLTATVTATPTNVNAFAHDADRKSSSTPSGTLVDYTGSSTGVTMLVNDGYKYIVGSGTTPALAADQSATPWADSYLWADSQGSALLAGTAGHDIFGDVMTDYGSGMVILHQNGDDYAPLGRRSQLHLIFRGLDPDARYAFAGIADADPGHRGPSHPGFSLVELMGVDSAVNNSILTTAAAVTALPGFGQVGLTTSFSYETDDLVYYDHIAPGSDGEFAVTVSWINDDNHQNWCPGFNAIAVAKHVAPEPATFSVLTLGGIALLWIRRK